jgi:hypothetical protein
LVLAKAQLRQNGGSVQGCQALTKNLDVAVQSDVEATCLYRLTHAAFCVCREMAMQSSGKAQ